MYKKCLTLILLLQTLLCLCQNPKTVDSILDIIESTFVDSIKASNYIELAKIFRFKKPNKTLIYARKALALYQHTNHHRGQSKAFFYQSSYYNSIGKIDSAKHYTLKNIEQLLLAKDTLKASGQASNIAYFELARGNTEKAITILDSLAPIFKHYADTANLARTYVVKSQAYNLKGYPNLSIEANHKALKLYRELKDTRNIAQSLMLIGNVYQGEGDEKKAIETFKEALALYKILDNKLFIAQAQSYLGDSFINLKEYTHAESHLNDALALSIELNFNENIARTYLNLGRLKLDLKQYDEAIKHFNAGQKLYHSLSIPHNETRAKFYLGLAHFEKGNYNKAIEYLDHSITISEKIEDLLRLSDALHYKSMALDKLGNSKSALDVFKRNKRLNDSLFNVETKQKTEELQIIYETEKREQQIAIQQNEIELLEQKSKNNNLQKRLLGLSLLTTFIISGLVFYSFRQKTKRNKAEKENLDNELEFKKKELTTHALHLAKKNEVLEHLKSKAEELKTLKNNNSGYQQLIRTINSDLQDDKSWDNFRRYFEEVHHGFSDKAQQHFPNITANDLRLMALLKMNLSSKEIANILSISSEGIKKARYRLRKKLNLSTEDSLEDFILAFA